MDRLRPGRAEVLVAPAAVGWAGALLAPAWGAVAAAGAVLGATLPFCRRLPPLAVAGVVAAELALWALGISPESPATLLAFVVSVFCLGRWARPGWLALPGVALPAVAFVRDDLNPASLVFTLVVVLLPWAAGRLVRWRERRAGLARREAAELARTDPGVRAERLVAEERARLAGEALGVIRAAVAGMLADADRAARDLDAGACAAVQESGRRAVAELRRLLGLLRSECEHADPTTSPPSRLRRTPWPLDVAIALVAVGVVVAEHATVGADRPWPAVLLTAASCLGLALLRTDAALACAVSAVPVAAALALDQQLFHGFEGVLVVVLLGWAAGADGRPRALVALAGWTLLALVEVHLHEPGNEPITLVLVLAGAVPGRLWRARRSEESAARATADRLRARQAEVAEQAVRAERLRVARELHDVASSAIGVMVLQAGAAELQYVRDPGAARDALDAVRTAGLQAQAELAVLFGLLDAGAVGAAGLAGPAPVADLSAAVGTLVDRMRAGGMDVVLGTDGDLGPLPASAGTAYRVVQESLTNAARHAPGSRVRVGLHRADGELRIDVRDDGPATEPADGGFGLVGLAERVRAEGGEVVAGPAPDGGFRVSARLPLRTSSTQAPA